MPPRFSTLLARLFGFVSSRLRERKDDVIDSTQASIKGSVVGTGLNIQDIQRRIRMHATQGIEDDPDFEEFLNHLNLPTQNDSLRYRIRRLVSGYSRQWYRKPISNLISHLAVAIAFTSIGVAISYRAGIQKYQKPIMVNPDMDERSLAITFGAIDENTEKLMKSVNAFNLPVTSVSRVIQFDHDRAQAINKSLEVYDQILRAESNSVSGQYRIAVAKQRIAELSSLLGEKVNAEEVYASSASILEKLVATEPANDDYQLSLASAYNNLARLYTSLPPRFTQPSPDVPPAEYYFAKSLSIRESLVQRRPESNDLKFQLAIGFGNLANWFSNDKTKAKDANALFTNALSIAEQLVHEQPDNPDYRNQLGRTHLNRGAYRRRRGDPESSKMARQDSLRAIEEFSSLVASHPQMVEYKYGAAAAFNNYGNLLEEIGDIDDAGNAYKRALEFREYVAQQFPEVPEYRNLVAQSYLNMAIAFNGYDRYQDAIDLCARALDIRKELLADYGERGVEEPLEYTLGLALCQSNMGNFVSKSADKQSAINWLDQALETLMRARERNPKSVDVVRYSRDVHWNKAQALVRLERHKLAIEEWKSVMSLSNELKDEQLKAPTLIFSAASRVKTGDISAIAELESAPPPKSEAAFAIYETAQAYGRLATVVSESTLIGDEQRIQLIERYVKLAVECLVEAKGKGFQKGFTSKDKLTNNPDFNALQDNDGFKQLISDIEARDNST